MSFLVATKNRDDRARLKMKGKNSTSPCESKFCPANTSVESTFQIKHCEDLKKPSPKLVFPPANLEQDEIARRYTSVDETQLKRNRELRKALDRQRQQRDDSARKYQNYVVAEPKVSGTAEASKIRLVLILGKLQQIGVEYKMLSQYFEECFKKLPENSHNTIIESLLVKDKYDLEDSNACYTSAINGVKKTKSTDYSGISDIVSGLAQIVRDFN